MPDQTPESRTLSLTVKVTPTEKRLVDLVALVHSDVDGVSNLIRPLIEPLFVEGREIEARLRGMKGEDGAQANVA